MLDIKKLAKLPRHEQARLMSEAMRDMDPAGWDKVAASVRKNMNAALRFTPHLFAVKH